MIAVLVLLALLSQAASAPPQPSKIDGAESHVYKTAGPVELRLHVFKTSGRAPHSAIVFFFGGAWTQGDVAQFAPQAKHLAQRGMVAILADYRVRSRHGTTPFEAMADARSAIRWVRSHAAQLGVDPNRVVAAGGSSGGHLAVSAAVFDTFDEPGEDTTTSGKPNALVLFNPAVDTSRGGQLFGDRGRDASPLHHVRAGLPPTLILHGKADTTVPYADVERYCAEASALGNQCRLVGYDGATHGFFNPGRGEKWFRETLLEADRFLTTLGYLPQ
jgi:acetyl esterase/lipase